MKTIENILKQSSLTIEDINLCIKTGNCNGCGGKGGFTLSDLLHKLPGYNILKSNELLQDLQIVCSIHDIHYNEGKTIKDFIIANYTLVNNVLSLLQWTHTMARLIIGIIIFGGTTIFGYKYFRKNTNEPYKR